MRQYVIDAFTDHVFAGNPAAVCVMDRWLDEAKMMAITIENNLSETAFVVREGEKYHLRWFTPGGEIDLCGHATLGTAYVIMNYVEPEKAAVSVKLADWFDFQPFDKSYSANSLYLPEIRPIK